MNPAALHIITATMPSRKAPQTNPWKWLCFALIAAELVYIFA